MCVIIMREYILSHGYSVGTGGSLVCGFLGSLLGGSIGKMKERSMNQEIDKQLIE